MYSLASYGSGSQTSALRMPSSKARIVALSVHVTTRPWPSIWMRSTLSGCPFLSASRYMELHHVAASQAHAKSSTMARDVSKTAFFLRIDQSVGPGSAGQGRIYRIREQSSTGRQAASGTLFSEEHTWPCGSRCGTRLTHRVGSTSFLRCTTHAGQPGGLFRIVHDASMRLSVSTNTPSLFFSSSIPA